MNETVLTVPFSGQQPSKGRNEGW